MLFSQAWVDQAATSPTALLESCGLGMPGWKLRFQSADESDWLKPSPEHMHGEFFVSFTWIPWNESIQIVVPGVFSHGTPQSSW